jgi:sugar transferase (PEP-CTERM/EpsH1 system associated)
LKVLFLANRIPYPPHRGDKLKIFNLARRLKKDHTLYLVTFAQNRNELTYKKELESIFDEVHLVYQPSWLSWLRSGLNFFQSTPFQVAYFKNPVMHKTLRKFLEAHTVDVIHTQHLRMSQYTRYLKGTYRILDLPDAYSLYWKRRKEVARPFLNKLFDNMESKRVVEYERVVYDFDLNLVCSVEDRDHLRIVHPKANIQLLRNGVDLEQFNYQAKDYTSNTKLLFTGNMDYAPNVDAVIYFVRNLFSQILKTHPNTKLVIAGQRPVKSVQELASERVEVTGFVEDISQMYTAADVVIAPLRFGAGTQNKVLEAMAMAVPVVCTDIGFKGLEIESGQGVIRASNDSSFVEEVIKLLSNEKRRAEVGQAGLKAAREKFSWDGISSQLEEYLKE